VPAVMLRDGISPWWIDLRLEPIFNTVPAASKNTAPFKIGQNQSKNNHFASLI